MGDEHQVLAKESHALDEALELLVDVAPLLHVGLAVAAATVDDGVDHLADGVDDDGVERVELMGCPLDEVRNLVP